jgi:hypothetical protein
MATLRQGGHFFADIARQMPLVYNLQPTLECPFN